MRVTVGLCLEWCPSGETALGGTFDRKIEKSVCRARMRYIHVGLLLESIVPDLPVP